MNLKLAISTCPNDTFMFDALVNKKIESRGYTFDVVMGDIEELNQQAGLGLNHITKVSFNAFAALTRQYQMSSTGAAIGFKNGPLIIGKHKIYPGEFSDVSIGIPGKNTTANLLVSILFPDATNKKEYLFSDIETAILDGEIDAGVIIHETRFSYHKKGLKKIADLGEIWENKTHLPLPLGGIAIKRDLSDGVKKEIQELIGRSVSFAFENPGSSWSFIKAHAQDIENDVIRKHIDLYVNRFSINCEKQGREAVEYIIKKAGEVNRAHIYQPVMIEP